ncbi:hypothetical protein Mycch_0718 [Mycolicibacterium chubuense NBB4]|uniref:Uncharacterized protein n=1 Tax=Mycolicibacterium chubuense (strain NBB4) TaxID=710421 RepID=I4BE28_MYCCN|nr:hypothetical protein Mycch_0718 [Mycolicibacterium chubuense NBB4]
MVPVCDVNEELRASRGDGAFFVKCLLLQGWLPNVVTDLGGDVRPERSAIEELCRLLEPVTFDVPPLASALAIAPPPAKIMRINNIAPLADTYRQSGKVGRLSRRPRALIVVSRPSAWL